MKCNASLSVMTKPDMQQDCCGWLGRGSNAKTAGNSKMWPMDGQMNLWTDWQGMEYSCVSATKKACLHFRTTEKKINAKDFWPFWVFWAKLPLPKCLWDPLNPFSCIPATTLQGGSHGKLNLALLPAINQLKKMNKKKWAGEGGGWHDHSSSYSVALKLDRISLYMSLNASLI